MMKKVLALALCVCMAAMLLAGCGGAGSSSAAASASGSAAAGTSASAAGALDPNIKATLTFATYDNEAMDLYEEMDLEGRFQELYPNVNIEIEEFKDDAEYFNQMKIRASAGELPDLMYLQTRYYPVFKDYMVDLSHTQAAANNTLAAEFAVDGKIIGVPEKISTDYVFYWADMFEEAGVEVPKTWKDFVAASEKLQSYFGAQDPSFMAIGMGCKDSWPMYPLMEYSPASFSGNGAYWDYMATVDEPFAEGEPIRDAYTKVYDLLQKGVLGSDPLGLGYDQALSLFLNHQAAMMVDNSMGLAKIEASGVDLTNLKTFYMPYTDEEGNFNHIVQGDFFLGITNTSENPELAEAFLEFYFAEFYPEFILRVASDSTMTNAPKDKDPYMVFADEEQPEYVLVSYMGGGDDYTAIVNECKFDYNKVGTSMLTDGFDLEATFAQLNADWSAAREKLGMK